MTRFSEANKAHLYELAGPLADFLGKSAQATAQRLQNWAKPLTRVIVDQTTPTVSPTSIRRQRISTAALLHHVTNLPR